MTIFVQKIPNLQYIMGKNTDNFLKNTLYYRQKEMLKLRHNTDQNTKNYLKITL